MGDLLLLRDVHDHVVMLDYCVRAEWKAVFWPCIAGNITKWSCTIPSKDRVNETPIQNFTVILRLPVFCSTPLRLGICLIYHGSVLLWLSIYFSYLPSAVFMYKTLDFPARDVHNLVFQHALTSGQSWWPWHRLYHGSSGLLTIFIYHLFFHIGEVSFIPKY